MHLERLRLQSLRNIDTLDLTFDSQFTVLWGHNGAGKTTVLEALWLTSALRSFRGGELAPLVARGRTQARVDVEIFDPVVGLTSALSVQLEVREDRLGRTSTRRTFTRDGKVARGAKDALGHVRAVLFTPEDLGVLRGAPSGRRQLLDRVCFTHEPLHLADVQNYEKLLRSRNLLLKPGRAGAEEVHRAISSAERARLIDTYDEQLAAVGGRILARRRTQIARLRPTFREAFTGIHTEHEARTRHACDIVERSSLAGLDARAPDDTGAEDPDAHDGMALSRALARALTATRRADEARGTTSVGPHRDDVMITLDGREAAAHASQGEARALMLAFKLAELRLFVDTFGHRPLLLLDDVSSELDAERTRALFSTLVRDVEQCILTTTSLSNLPWPSGVSAHAHAMHEGRLSEPPTGT